MLHQLLSSVIVTFNHQPTMCFELSLNNAETETGERGFIAPPKLAVSDDKTSENRNIRQLVFALSLCLCPGKGNILGLHSCFSQDQCACVFRPKFSAP